MSVKTKQKFKDQLFLTECTIIPELLCENEVLQSLRNECIVDYQALEINKKRLQVTNDQSFYLGSTNRNK